MPETSYRVGRASAGLGLFATAPIEPGEYIEYVGEIISDQEANHRKNNRYLFEINTKWTIDGSNRANKARYINHSCHPNCESLVQHKRVFVKAIRQIEPGEELTYDYGAEYVDEFIAPHGCKCSACS